MIHSSITDHILEGEVTPEEVQHAAAQSSVRASLVRGARAVLLGSICLFLFLRRVLGERSTTKTGAKGEFSRGES